MMIASVSPSTLPAAYIAVKGKAFAWRIGLQSMIMVSPDNEDDAVTKLARLVRNQPNVVRFSERFPQYNF